MRIWVIPVTIRLFSSSNRDPLGDRGRFCFYRRVIVWAKALMFLNR